MKKIMPFALVAFTLTLFCSFPLQSAAQNWSSFPNGGANDWVYASCIYNGELIVAGKFTSIGGVSANRIAKWNGSTWAPLGSGVNGKVWALTVYDGDLYVGGEFTMAGGITMDFIAKWNGSIWLDDLGDMGSIVSSLTVYNNKLIIGGYFTDADGTPANHIVAFDDANGYVPLGAGLGGTQGQVMALTVWNNQLVAGGFFTTAGGQPAAHIATWNGSTWSTLGSGISGIVYALSPYNGNLVAGGLFTGAGGNPANHIASWNGSSWSAFGSGMSGTFYQYVFALIPYGGYLVAGGYFTHSNGIQTNGIARWDGSTWSPLGSGLWYPANVYGAHNFSIYGTDLVVGGLFSNAGGIGASHIAKVNFVTPGVTLNLKVYLQGYYTGAGFMTPVMMNEGVGTSSTATDSIDVDLYDGLSLSWAGSTRTLLQTNGTATCSFPTVTAGSYYIVVRHRNTLETWSALPQSLGSVPITYDFTTAASKAYGNNMKQVQAGKWALYTGELTLDGNIDLLDNTLLETGIFNFDFGYMDTDLNGDGNVDLLDAPVMDENVNNFIYVITP